MTMTQTRKYEARRRMRIAALGAAFAVAAVLGPGMVGTTRLGVSEVAGYATVSAADTITSHAVLAGVAAAT